MDGTSHCSIIETTAQVCITFRRRYLLSTHRFARTDIGKVLAGIQVPPDSAEEFDKFLQNLGYHFVEETDNPVVKKYLRG